jgi:defect-in-organelle-trafficking protein DotA
MGMIPLVGGLVKIIVSFTLPLMFSWLALFMHIGITVAYYVPMLPYIIFLFGSIGWLMAVMEAMVAAPILALGVMSPEGEGLSGKSERGFLILVNVFLRPSMMIVGYVISIALSFVAVHLLIMGYSRGAAILNLDSGYAGVNWSSYVMTRAFAKGFSIFIVINLYATIVQKCFTLIFILPDRVMRWIGGGPESYGADTEKWLEEMKGSVDKFAESTDKGMAAGTQKLMTQLGTVAADIAKAIATKGKSGKGGGGASGGGT